MHTSTGLGLRSALAFVALGGALLFGACAVDTRESEDATQDEEVENVESAEQATVSGWTPYTSEEYPPIVCDNGSLMSAVQCSGQYCDNIRAYCQPAGGALGGSSWTPFFSEEGTSSRVCLSNAWVTAIACQGSYCDNIAPQCTTVTNLREKNCVWTGWVSEENGGTLSFGNGYYMKGAQCNGTNCDNKRFLVCQTEPVSGCSPSSCGGMGDGCWCDAACVQYGDCCTNACSVCGTC